MTRDESVGLGAIHADDELLDRLARRDDASFAGLEAMLASWAAQIDADGQATADRSGPLGLRPSDAGVAATPTTAAAARPEPRTIRIAGSRAAAVVGAFAITMSGGGVAAALTGHVPIVSSIAASAASAQVTEQPQNLDEAYTQAVERSVAQGRHDRARKIIEVMGQNLGPSANPADAAKLDALNTLVNQAEIIAAGKSSATPTSVPSVLAGSATTTALGLPSSMALATLMTTGAPSAALPSSAAMSTVPSGAVAAGPVSTTDIDPRGATQTPTAGASGGSSGATSGTGTSPTNNSGSGSGDSPSNRNSRPAASATATVSGVRPVPSRPRPTDSATPSPSQTPTTAGASAEASGTGSSGGSSITGSSSAGARAGVLPSGSPTRGGTTSDRTVSPTSSAQSESAGSRASGSATERSASAQETEPTSENGSVSN